MVEEGHISVDEMKAAKAERAEQNVQSKENLFADVAPYFTEHVRRPRRRTSGEEVVLKKGGWLIETTIDVSRQRLLEALLKGGLDRLDRRMGYWGPIDRVAPGRSPPQRKPTKSSSLAQTRPRSTASTSPWSRASQGALRRSSSARSATLSCSKSTGGCAPPAGMR